MTDESTLPDQSSRPAPPWLMTLLSIAFALGVGSVFRSAGYFPDDDRLVFMALVEIPCLVFLGCGIYSFFKGTWKQDVGLRAGTGLLVLVFLLLDPYMMMTNCRSGSYFRAVFRALFPMTATVVGAFLASLLLQRGRYLFGTMALVFWGAMSWLFWVNVAYLKNFILMGKRGVGIWGYWVS